MLQESANNGRSNVAHDDCRRNKVTETTSETASAGSTKVVLGSVLLQILEDHFCECAGPVDVERLGATAEEGMNVVPHHQNRFELDKALGVWKRQ